ncbi:MAG: YigZ family protein [Methanobrevibacter sp.]|jgi:uncharacterized YigZ family protein|nr:YigZ family protein [Candidatus Methanovirga aequatorialis]
MKTIDGNTENKIEIKKSLFICRLFPVKNLMEVKEIVKTVSTKYGDATHNCTAFVVNEIEGFDDDDEPGGTAGKPMLNVLKQNNLKNILAIVTRYFGGIKLGASGLVRAYSKSVQETIAISNIVHLYPYQTYELTFDYFNLKFIKDEIRKNNFKILKKDFDENVHFQIAIDNDNQNLEKLKNKLRNSLNIKSIGEEYLNLKTL